MTPRTSSRAQPVALVTGGAKRIGRAITLALSQAGFAVAIHAERSASDAKVLAAQITQAGRRAAVVHGDLVAPDAPAKIIRDAALALGPLTLLVNNASIFEADEVGSLHPEAWDRHFAINLRAPVFLAESFAAQVPAGADASIVNVVDQRVRKLTPRQFSYTLSKAALHAATTTLAQALAPRVRVNAVAPGPTLPSPRQDPAQFAAQAASLPLERGPSPEAIAAAVVFLAQADSVTGETIAVDGGQHIAWKTADAWGIEE